MVDGAFDDGLSILLDQVRQKSMGSLKELNALDSLPFEHALGTTDVMKRILQDPAADRVGGSRRNPFYPRITARRSPPLNKIGAVFELVEHGRKGGRIVLQIPVESRDGVISGVLNTDIKGRRLSLPLAVTKSSYGSRCSRML